MSSVGIPHPDAERLLRFADGELENAEARNIRTHLEACWECRSEIEGLQQTIAACIHYRKAVLETCMPAAPRPWFDIHRSFEKLNTAAEPRRWSFPRPRRWIPVGAIAAAVAVLFFYLENAPSARASDLLQRAAVAAKSRPEASRRIQIRTRNTTFVRNIQLAHAPARAAEAGSPAALELAFRAAHYNWDDPLSAAAYAGWRDQLRQKKDQVVSEPDGYLLRTTTEDGQLVEASLKLRAMDLRPVEGTLRFRNSDWVEMTELPGEVVAESAASAPSAAPATQHPAPAVLSGEASFGDELAVVAALHQLGADLGDPVEVTRTGSSVIVSGTGLPEARRREIRGQLEGMPHVLVRFDDPALEPVRPEPAAPARSTAAGGRLQQDLEQRLGGRANYDRFVDGVLDGTDAMMSRAHALRRLAARFPRAAEPQLSSAERATLRRLAAEHAAALRQSVASLEMHVRPALEGVERPAPITSAMPLSWQDSAENLFSAARRADALLIDMLGGTGASAQSQELPGQVLTALAQLRALAENYERLTKGQ